MAHFPMGTGLPHVHAFSQLNTGPFSMKFWHKVEDLCAKTLPSPPFLFIFFVTSYWRPNISEQFFFGTKSWITRYKKIFKKGGEGRVFAHTSSTLCQNFIENGPVLSCEYACSHPCPCLRRQKSYPIKNQYPILKIPCYLLVPHIS